MSFPTRLAFFLAIAAAGILAWHWNTTIDSARDMTQLALQQFHHHDAAGELQQASFVQNWWPLLWPVVLAVLALVLFWDDLERWWTQEQL